jgi:hypothetical protein
MRITREHRVRIGEHPDRRLGRLRVVTVGVVHPGEMGARLAAALRGAGHRVLWVSAGRSTATAERARAAGLEDARTLVGLCRESDVLLVVCPPHAALEVARTLPPFDGVYVDANAVSPATARAIAETVSRYVDGGIIGAPRPEPGSTRLYLSGAEARDVAALFDGTTVDAPVVSEQIGAASALKMAYSAWSKGSSALLLATRATARAEGVEDALLAEWRISQPDAPDRSIAAARSALRKGWRWAGEMEEIAATFAAAGLPDGFHLAAAEIYRRSPHEEPDDAPLERMLPVLPHER